MEALILTLSFKDTEEAVLEDLFYGSYYWIHLKKSQEYWELKKDYLWLMILCMA